MAAGEITMALKIIDTEYDKQMIAANLHRLTGQVFRLLPVREEGGDWLKPLETAILEITGLFAYIEDTDTGLAVLSKLQGIFIQGETCEFSLFRRTIFECCTLLSRLEQNLLSNE